MPPPKTADTGQQTERRDLLAPHPGWGTEIPLQPVVSLRSTTGYRLSSLRDAVEKLQALVRR